MGVKELSTVQLQLEKICFSSSAHSRVNPSKAWTCWRVLWGYLMTQLLTHIAQQSCQAMEAAPDAHEIKFSPYTYTSAFPSPVELCVHSAVS